MPRISKGSGILIFLLVAGGFFGSLLGELAHGWLSFLAFGRTIGLSPTTMDLLPLTLTFGLTLKINIATIIGFFLALFIYNRL